jgi:hypothetical protein
MEYEEDATPSDTIITSFSEHLDKLVRQEVERTIENEMKKIEVINKHNTF